MSFEQVKRESSNLERQIEEKMSRYQQLAQKMSQSSATLSTTSRDALARAEEGADSSSNNISKEELTSLQQELQRNLSRFAELVNARLESVAVTSSHHAQLKRFRDILLDLKNDYEKCVSTIKRAQERQELLGGAGNGLGGGSGNDPSLDPLLRERNHINNSLNSAAHVIGQADSIRSDLYTQGRSLRGTQSLMSTLTTNIPGLNHLVDAIRKKRTKDDKIVAGVIASCIVFTLWYLLG